MNNNRRWLVLATIILAVVLIIFLIYFFFFYHFNAPTPPPATPSATTESSTLPAATGSPQTDNNPTVVDIKPPAATQADIYQAGLTLVAKNFVERFGTYTSQSASSYADDLALLTTERMQTWVKNQVAGRQAGDNYKTYTAMTTRVINVSVLVDDEKAGQGSVLLEAQKTTEVNGQSATVKQTVKVELVKEGSAWKVDSAYWQ